MNPFNNEEPFYLQKGNIWAVPILHYNMEMAAQVRLAFNTLQPDCVAVELAETMQLQLLHAASRLPDIAVIITYDAAHNPIYYMCEPCDGAFEGLRSALEAQIPAWCIDLDVEEYPNYRDHIPDPYAIQRIGLKNYYEAYQKLVLSKGIHKTHTDFNRELYMAKRLKELSYSYDKILFVGGMSHIENIFEYLDNTSFPLIEHVNREVVQLCTLTELSCRDTMAEYGWMSLSYENLRPILSDPAQPQGIPDRQKIIYALFKEAALNYTKNSSNSFPGYHFRNIMKFLRNYAWLYERLMPDLFQIITASKGCVDHNYAYEVWELATDYPYRKNIDNLPELDLTIEQLWGKSKLIQFHLKIKNPKSAKFAQKHLRKKNHSIQFHTPLPFSICSYPPEDISIERFGEFLKKKGAQLTTEDAVRTIPFSTSLEDGIDTRETIRHWHERKLYVKTKGKPGGAVGSVVVIFDDPSQNTNAQYNEKHTWLATWHGEHAQESDMAFYATPMTTNVIGPGISRCEYGGFLMSYPPRRLLDVWSDPDYESCRSKAEMLLMAGIDYAVQPLITYVAPKPPRSALKSYAKRFDKKIVYIPLGQLSPNLLNKLRVFHVLDGHHRRKIADEYIS